VKDLLEGFAERLPDHFTVATEVGVRILSNLPSS
jgi:hypothetical protein